METALTIELPPWIITSELKQIFDVLGEGNALLVGGCVRNAVLEVQKTDIDIATTHKPETVVDLCDRANIKTVPIGIDHGTVMAVMNDQSFEITTLRKDIETDGRHAQVEFCDDWLEDAKRRDFTMNTLYMNMNGDVFDPLECGLDDLQKRHVIFVGDADERIAEDYLRILRFFRFHAQYGEGKVDEAGLQACTIAADKIDTLSRERITQEFLKILATDHAADVLGTMFDNSIMSDLPNEKYDANILRHLISNQKEQGALNLMSRLFVLGGNKPNLFEKYLRLSHEQKKFLIKLEMATDEKLYENDKALKKAIFYHGNDLLVQGYFLLHAIKGERPDSAQLLILQNWQAPECPITGDTLIAEGFQTGPELGLELKRRTEEWLEEI